MAYKVKYINSSANYDTRSIGVYDGVRADDSNTISSFDGKYEYYVGVPRRCSRCRMYNWDGLGCKKKKKAETCRKSYSIKKVKKC